MRHSSVARLTATSANSPSVHQPCQGATSTRAAPIAPAQRVRALRVRAPASAARVRSSSVGHRKRLSHFMISLSARGRRA